MTNSPNNSYSLEMISNDNSISTKEFLNMEKRCEGFKDSDEEIKMILSEINKLSVANKCTKSIEIDTDDVELILKKAEDISKETQILLKSSPIPKSYKEICSNIEGNNGMVPQIKVTEPIENSSNHQEMIAAKTELTSKQSNKENSNGIRRKPKTRPYSAGVVDTKKRDAGKISRLMNNSPKKVNSCKQETLVEELKDTNERVKSLELLNVQLNDDNKILRKKLDQISEDKHITDLKLAECEKFVGRLGKEYENKSDELKAVKDNESRLAEELNKERDERKNLSIQHDKDAGVVKDLQRQVKEMEMILKRKHPDSVSALIVASKSSTVDDNKKKLLEDRIMRLEQELKDKENHFHGVLMTLQEKFGDMKQKYENHIIDIERQLMDDRKVNTDLKSRLGKMNITDASVQTLPSPRHNVATQTTVKVERASSAVSRMTQNSALFLNKLKEDSYLVATIKGLQAELTVKQRTISKINRETEELRKNLRNLQKEKEVLLNLNPPKKSSLKPNKSAENILLRVNSEMEADMSELRKQKDVLALERNTLLDSLKRTNEEFIFLKKKRIQDLHTLQVAHEKELMQMNMQLYPLHEEIKLLNRTVEILQDRIRAADDKLSRHQLGIKDTDMYAGGDNHVSAKVGKKDSR